MFMDRLDKYYDKERKDLIGFLSSLAIQYVRVYICISGRDYPLLSILKCPEIIVEDNNSTTISHFVASKLLLTNFKFQRRELIQTLVSKVNGIFY